MNYAVYALVSLSGTISAAHRISSIWPADTEHPIVSAVDPVSGTWLLFWDGGLHGELDGRSSWGMCGLALLVDANGGPIGDPFQIIPWGTTTT